MSAYQTSYEVDNAIRYAQTCGQAIARSEQPDYKNCGVNVCAVIKMVNGVPQITGYKLSDWYDDSVVASFVNGKARFA